MKAFPLPPVIKDFAAVFKKSNHDLYIVGGAVRDWLIGIANNDYDFTTDALTDEVSSMFRRTIPTGIKHGTITVHFKGEAFEVTTFRTDGDYHDGRHPDSVTFVRSLSEDLMRRDFTINALAADAYSGQIIDEHRGINDLHEKKIRAIGNPVQRFSEDALRLMRACRFAAKLNFEVEEKTKEAMCALSPTISKVSKERIHDELVKTLMTDYPVKGIELMRETGLLKEILPELQAEYGCEQNGCFHDYDVYHHSLNALQVAVDNNFDCTVRLAALLHDVGKPPTRVEALPRDTFYYHDQVGEKMVRDIMSRLKFSNAEIDATATIVGNHMVYYDSSWSDSAIRRLINKVGTENLDNLYKLKLCDNFSIDSLGHDITRLNELFDRISSILSRKDALTFKDLSVSGDDLATAGIPRGKIMGAVLKELLETVIDDPAQNNRDQLLTIAQNIYRKLSDI